MGETCDGTCSTGDMQITVDVECGTRCSKCGLPWKSRYVHPVSVRCVTCGHDPTSKPPMPREVARLLADVAKLEALDEMYDMNIDSGTLYESAAGVKALYSEGT
jgi:hypothetical protein